MHVDGNRVKPSRRVEPGARLSIRRGVQTWEVVVRATAIVNTCWVVYCNRVGWEEGSFYPGGSHVVRPGGEVLARAPYLDEHLLVTELDLREVDRLRWRLPLVQDVRRDIRGTL